MVVLLWVLVGMAGVRRVYGKPWSKLAQGMNLDRKTLQRLGRALVRAIRMEAARTVARQKGLKIEGSPESLPDTPRFLDSFGYRIVGRSTVEITCTWPFIEQLIEGRDPYRMVWLTQQAGIGKVPMTQPDGTVIIRTTPRQMSDAWIHPGWARHTFIERGVKRGRDRMAEIIVKEVGRQLAAGDPFK